MPLPPIAAALELHAAVLLNRTPAALAGGPPLRYVREPPDRNDMKDAHFEARVGDETNSAARCCCCCAVDWGV